MGNTVSFYGRSSRILVEQLVQKRAIKDCQIAECDLSGLSVIDAQWDHADIRDLHANDSVIQNSKLENSTFFRSSFMRASFIKTVLDTMVFDGLTLIKSRWDNTWVNNTVMKNLCLQRSGFFGSRFISSSLLDFEALDTRIDNCIFAHSMFSINYGSGMNGFSGADFTNSIFYHCRFEGYPLRGARLASCVFIHCSGEISDDIECTKVAGIGLRGNAQHKPLQRMNEARRLIERYVS
ncbi:MAG: hypothetical protein LBI14_00355 [Treponema sp.]|jgi:uncharacterized protein YjbI with pentapeptide repeats|nr:hypothetical protein [Treponema sp.]